MPKKEKTKKDAGEKDYLTSYLYVNELAKDEIKRLREEVTRLKKSTEPKQLNEVDALTAYLYADSLQKTHIKILQDEVTRLTKLTEWQPIETAPKDGTFIVACCADEPFSTPEIVNWGILQQYDDPEDVYCWLLDYDFPINPTHWIPIPTLPKQ